MKNIYVRFIIVIFCLLLMGIPSSAQVIGPVETYRNPAVPGDFLDPTAVRFGDKYYAAGTSNDFAPNYPLYESTDLVNWKQIGSIFNEIPEWASGNFWAPELSYNKGTFYMYYTAKRKTDNFSCIGVATPKDIHKGFTDHGIIVEWGKEAIDAFVLKDTDGNLYITWKTYGLDKDRPIEIRELKMPKPEFLISTKMLRLSGSDSKAVFVDISPQTGNYSMETCVVNNGAQWKGLSFYGNHTYMLCITSGSNLEVVAIKNGEKQLISKSDLPANDKIFQKVESTHGSMFRFYWSVNHIDRIARKDKDNNPYINEMFLPRWTLPCLQG
ncbi:MAG: family 43 glycosylhydrolase [Bacteroidota bacterium]|nr:family 43 glycosylhydrolase [Bacteroidota bacterium]